MRKIIGWIVLGVGGFLLMTSVLLLAWAPGKVQRTPLNIDSVTRLSGEAEKLNVSTGELESFPVKVTSITKAIPDRSTGDVIVFKQATCVMQDEDNAPDCAKDDPRVVTQSEEITANNRTSATAVNDVEGMDPIDPPAEGLVIKFPFNTQQKTYEVWDGTAGIAVPTTFEAVEEVQGLQTYRFHSELRNAQIDIAEGVAGTYSLDKTMWVEPVTGAIIDQEQHDVRTITDGNQLALDMTVGYTDEQVTTNVADGRANSDKVNLILDKAPWFTLGVGLVVLAIGSFTAFPSGRRSRQSD